ncbi:ATP-grasp domain-containing protein [Streptomyces sp. NBC_01478]|uniref:ATP-grasp domain-containing protein n=1 Tax=Streptomyces sp. NBC_01478 TaxID=2903882 RepID=UPI002E3794C7|nr:ATP-grasp domain-containing protein [Streptomyces sp. NBC_01478]
MPTLTQKDHVVIVDAYSGGRYLIPAFQSLGYPVIHVQSGSVGPFSRDNEVAAARADIHLVNDGDVSALVETLRAASTRIVLAGSEGGVLLADQLADSLDLPFRNHTELSMARRDKFDMQDQLRKAGVASIKQARVTDAEELDAWLTSHGAYPVVVKPLLSAATESVFVCHSHAEAHKALDVIIGSTDLFGNRNDAAVCQEFLVGVEYVINGIACQGRCSITEAWQSDKVDNHGFHVYDTQYLFCEEDPGFTEITEYVGDACRALGLVNGPFHAEVMLTDRGPVLIEVGARIAGGADPYVVESCLGHSQVRWVVQASLNPAAFTEARELLPPVPRSQRAAYVYLIAKTEGRVREADLSKFLSVGGVMHVSYQYAAGDRQMITKDAITAAGVVLLTAETEEELNGRVRQVREIEASMYEAIIDRESA